MDVKDLSPIHSFTPAGRGRVTLTPEQATAMAQDGAEELRSVGIFLPQGAVSQMASAAAMDDAQGGVFTANGGVPVQFLQAMLPGLISSVLAPRKADALMPTLTAGSWEDEQVVFQAVERSGNATIYSDYSPVQNVDFNYNFDVRTIVRIELGAVVNDLERKRMAKINIDPAAQKRIAASEGIANLLNLISFYGYNSGSNKTYGLLNDPNLDAVYSGWRTPANGASGNPLWTSQTAFEIIAQIQAAAAIIQTQTQGRIDPRVAPMKLAVPPSRYQYLTTPNPLITGSVEKWLTETYKSLTIEVVPQLETASGNNKGFILYAEHFEDEFSTDGGATVMQVIPARFLAQGAVPTPKGGYIENYTAATAGALVKRPLGFVRYAGI